MKQTKLDLGANADLHGDRLLLFDGPGLRVAGTGHRPDRLGGYSEPVRRRLVEFASSRLSSIAKESEIAVVISGMALGWDQALAEAALSLGLRVVAAVPFDGQDATWPPESRRRYRDLLAKTTIHTVCIGPYKAWKMQARNEWMVDRADVLLALWNGLPGGTGSCMSYAAGKKDGLRIENLWEEWERWPPQS